MTKLTRIKPLGLLLLLLERLFDQFEALRLHLYQHSYQVRFLILLFVLVCVLELSHLFFSL